MSSHREAELSIRRPVAISIPSSTDRRELAWSELFQILNRNRWLSIAIITLVLLATAIGTLLMQPIYQAIARLEIDPPNGESFSLLDSSSLVPADPDYLETQAQIIRSQTLALEVIRKLKLHQNPDIVGTPSKRLTLLEIIAAPLKAILPRRYSQAAPNASSDGVALSHDERAALVVYETNLTVGALRESKLVSVGFSCPNPSLAATITNTLIDEYLEKHYRTRYETVMEETRWLARELDDLRGKVESSNQALADFQNRNGIVNLKENENTTTQTVEQLTQLLNTAKGDRIQLEAEVKILYESGVDALPQTRGSNLIMELSKVLADASANLAQARAIYGENNANVRKYQNQVDELRKQLDAERERIAQSLKASYNSSVAREQLLTRSLDRMSGKIHEMNETAVKNSELKKQVEVNENLYNALFAKLKEAGISAGLRSSTIQIVDRALVPDRPIKPELRVNLGLGFVLALLLGVAAPVLKELLADRVHGPQDVRKATGLSPIGVVPVFPVSRKREILSGTGNVLLGSESSEGEVVSDEVASVPNSIEAEAVRNLCTWIKLASPKSPPRVVLVTSATPGEGKTTIAVRLARVLAESTATCVLDADLRNPSIARAFGVKSENGLSQVLSGATSLERIVRGMGGIEKLTMVPGGSVPVNPGRLVFSENMREIIQRLSEQFQNVVIDSPPVLPFADARLISRFVDGVLVVSRSGLTTNEHLRAALEILAEVHAPVLGVILNGLDERSSYYKRYESLYALAADKQLLDKKS